MVKASRLLLDVQDVLFRDWDPIGVSDYEACRDEYDSYAPELVRLLLDGADEYKLAVAHYFRTAGRIHTATAGA